MYESEPSLGEICHTISYWRECGVAFLAGDHPAVWKESVHSVQERGREKKFLPQSQPGIVFKGDVPSVSPKEPVYPVPLQLVEKPSLPPLSELERIHFSVLTGAERAGALQKMAHEVAVCQRCGLSHLRKQMVFGYGSPQARVVFVGESPGEQEEAVGLPFVGPMEKFFDLMLRAVDLKREEVYLVLVVKCRPPLDRNPQPGEIAMCQGYLFNQLHILQPRVIMAMGQVAIQTLLGGTEAVGRVRGRVVHWQGIPVIPTYHPKYYFHAGGRKRAAWEDLIRLLLILKNSGQQ
ncbi:MAG: uracil-DNA glycosylase [Magnetococcus sp. DMHC-6]